MSAADAKVFWQQFEDPAERKEVLGLLPPLADLDVVELAAGIGRITGDIADKGAKTVRSYDFIQGLCDTNAQSNAHRTNVEVHCQDVTTMELPDDTADMVFSNWLFMYLGDEEVSAAFSKITKWLRPGGHFFLRESCDAPSSTSVIKDIVTNPTNYRTKDAYERLLVAAEGLLIQKTGVVQAYVEIAGVQNQNYWLLVKSAATSCTGFKSGDGGGGDEWGKQDSRGGGGGGRSNPY